MSTIDSCFEGVYLVIAQRYTCSAQLNVDYVYLLKYYVTLEGLDSLLPKEDILPLL